MDNIIFTRDGAVARITLNRPDSLNAINEPMLQELQSALEEIRTDDDIKVMVMNGAGRAFSAGVDIKTTSADGFAQGGSFMDVGLKVGNMITNMPKVTIAQVHGYCFTGALEMMLFFDMAFCTENTQFGDTHAKWSIMPRWGMTQRLARRVGLAKAKELTFRALRIKGAEAERIGLVNRAFPEKSLAYEVNKIIADVEGNSFEAIVAIKKLYDAGYGTTLNHGLMLEANTQVKLPNTDEQLAKFNQ